MSCEISDIATTLKPDGSSSVMIGVQVTAAATFRPFFATLDGNSRIIYGPLKQTTANDGSWSFKLPWPSESDPDTAQWQITTPDGSTFVGTVPEGVAGPLTIHDLKNSHGWGLAAGLSQIPYAIQGAPKTPGLASDIQPIGSALAAGSTGKYADAGHVHTLPASSVVALTDATSIATDASTGSVFSVTLGGNRTLANPTNLVAGGTYLWLVKQDGTGSRTLAYGNLFAWPAGTAPTLTTDANAVDLITAVYDGSKLRAVFTGDMR